MTARDDQVKAEPADEATDAEPADAEATDAEPAQAEPVKAAPVRADLAKAEASFERAKLPMVIAAVGIAGGLAIAGSVERTAGGAIVLGAWVLGIAALHRLGRAGSVDRGSDRGSER